MAERDESLPVGERYIDLGAPERGVQTVQGKERVLASTVVTSRSVTFETWNKLVSELPDG